MKIVSWNWSQVSGPAVLLESPAMPTTRFRAPDVAAGGADIRLRLDVTDNSGNHASDTVNVHVFDRRDRRTFLTWRSPPGDYIGQGRPLSFSLADGDASTALRRRDRRYDSVMRPLPCRALTPGSDN